VKSSDVPRMTLRRAVEWCGGVDALGDALNVDGDSPKQWISGGEEVPHEVFVQAVGLILEASASKPGGRRTPDSNDGGRKDPRH
jgi:hypothetical protein